MKFSTSFLLVLLAPALSWAGAGSLGETNVSLSSGTATVGVEQNALKVVVVSQPNTPVIVADQSSSDAELGRLFHTQSGIKTVPTGTETSAYLWVNLSTSAIDMIFDRIYMSVFDTDMIFRFYANPPVISSGTYQSPLNAISGSTVTAMVHAYSSPVLGTKPAPEYVFQITDRTFIDDIGSRLIFKPGQKVALTVTAGATNKDWAIDLFWVEK